MNARSILVLLLLISPLAAQEGAGPLVPPTGPQDGTYRTLGEIWDKLVEIEGQNAELTTQNSILATQVAALQTRLDAVPLDTTRLLLKNLEEPFPWVDALVSGNEFDGVVSSLAFSPSGEPGIAFYQGADGFLGYAWRSEGVWQVETVDATPEAGNFISLAFTPDGRPAIAYFLNDPDPANRALRYAVKVGDSWQSEIVLAGPQAGFGGALRVGSDGHPRIGFEGSTPGGDAGVILATHDGSAWSFERVTPLDGTTFTFLNMELLSDDRAFFAYSDVNPFIGGTGTTYSAVFEGGAWQIEQINPSSTVGAQVRLAIAPGDRPIVAFRLQESSAPLRYGVYREDDEGGFYWQTEIAVPYGGSNFDYFDISVDGEGRPVIAHAATFQPLSIVTRGVYDWTSGEVLGDRVGRGSFAMSPAGEPAFSYYDEHLDGGNNLRFVARELIEEP